MKRITLMFLIIVFILSTFPTALAEDEWLKDSIVRDYCSYRILDDETVEITRFQPSEAPSYSIPAYIDGFKVKAVGPDVIGENYPYSFFAYNEECTEVEALEDIVFLEEGIEVIEANAFSNMGGYINTGGIGISLPDSIKRIEDQAMGYCYLETPLPKCLEHIGSLAFYDSMLKNVTLPESLKTMGNNPFAMCENLKEITIEKGCDAFQMIDGVLYDASGTRLICYPAGREDVRFEVPDGVRIIGAYAFSGCTLEEIVLPDSIEVIESCAFGCDSSSAPRYSYGWKSKLKRINIPGGVRSIGDNPFCNCFNLTDITVSGDQTKYIWKDSFLIERETGRLILGLPNCMIGDLYIPNTIQSIGGCAFNGCYKITSVVLPDGIGEICDQAFAGCHNLMYINFPESLISIGEWAFCDCYRLELGTIELPKRIKEIGAYAFLQCGFEALSIPGNVKEIWDYAFYGARISSLILHEETEIIGNYSFQDAGIEQLSLPNSITTIGEYAFCGNRFISIEIPANVKEIKDNAFCCNPSLGRATMPEGLKRIGNQAFYRCWNLEEATIPESVEEIGNYAFSRTLIRDYWIPKNVREIGEEPFSLSDYSYGDQLIEIKVDPENQTFICDDRFLIDKTKGRLIYAMSYNDDAVATLIVPEGIKVIDAYLFDKYELTEQSSSIDEIILPKTLFEIGKGAFRKTSIKTMVIPDGTVIIGSRAFDGCGQLQSIFIPPSVKVIGKNAFRHPSHIYKPIEGLTIYGETGSAIEEYAKENGIPFEAVAQDKKSLTND